MTGHHASPERRARRRRAGTRGIAVVAALATIGLSAACKSSSSSASGGGAGFFKGKTITLIAPDAPGGTYDAYARLFAPYVAKELGATINVENVNGGGTLVGSDQMAAANPNGLTIGMVNVGGDISAKVEKQPGGSFSMSSISWIAQPAVVPNVLVTQPGSSVPNLSALLGAKSPVTVLDIRNGIGDTLNRVVLGALKVPNKLDTGFEETTDLKQGFLAKDGQLVFEALSTLYPLLAGHEAVPLLTTGSVTLPAYRKVLGDTPTLQTELSHMSLPSGTKAALQEVERLGNLVDDFAAPPGLPASELATLRTAFAKAAASPALLAQATKESLPVALTGGATLAGQVNTAQSQATSIAPYLK